MRILSWNVRGLGGLSRKLVVKYLVKRQKIQIALLQETKLKHISDATANQLWGKRYVKWVAVDAVGSAGGMMMLSDSHSISVINSWKDVFSLSLLVEDLTNNSR